MSNSLAKAFSKNLRERREKAGLGQQALAQRLGCVASFVSMLEAGERIPSLDTVEHAAKIFKVHPLALLGGKPNGT